MASKKNVLSANFHPLLSNVGWENVAIGGLDGACVYNGVCAAAALIINHNVSFL